MSNPSIKLSSRVAFSYHWNKCIDNHEFCFKRLVKSIASFFQGFCGRYTVSVADVKSFLANKEHENSIFHKHYKKNLAELNTNTTSVNGLATSTVKSRSNILLDKLTNLLASNEFESSDDNFSEENLKLLHLNDRLLLLISASQKDKSEIVRRLLSIGNLDLSKNLSATTKTAIFSSFIRKNFLPGVEYMLKNNLVAIDTIDADGITPLIGAIKKGSVECTNLLLKNGASVDDPDNEGYTPLHWSVKINNEEFMTALLDKGADINKPTHQGSTPLHLSVHPSKEGLLKTLLDKGAKPNVANVQGMTPLDYAIIINNARCCELLLAAGANSIDGGYSYDVLAGSLFNAAERNHKECVKILMETKNVDINCQDFDNNTPLHLAAIRGHQECTDTLLENPKINVNILNYLGLTPLGEALFQSHSACVELLLDHQETNVNCIKGADSIPLLLAVCSNISLQCFKKFLHANGLRFDVKDSDNCTPIHCAIRTNKLHNLKELLNVKNMRVHINEKAKDGDTALHCAIKNKKIAYIQALLSQCKDEIDVTVQDSKGMTPLECLNKLEVSGTDYEECKKTLQNLDKRQ